MSHRLGYHSPMTRKKHLASPRVHLHALERLMRICDEIRSGGCPNKGRLARVVERHERTVQRDLDALRDQFNAPLVFDRERKFHPTEVHEELPGGKLRVKFETTEAALGQVARWLMQYGRHVRVIEPEALRKTIREEVAAMVGLYGSK